MPRPFANWYCISIKHKQEKIAEENLQNQGYATFFPVILDETLKKPILKPAFPGYAFVAWRLPLTWRPILSTMGVKGFALVYRDPKGHARHPTPLPYLTVDRFQSICNDQVVDPTVKVRLAPIPRNATVEVLNGPLTSFRGVCQLPDAERIVVLLSLFGRDTQVEFQRNQLKVIP